MKKILNGFTATLVCLFLYQTVTLASSHREAPLISNDPLADNTDLYAFRSPCDSSKIMLIANYIPFEHPAGGPNWYTFGENIRYEIHVDNNTATKGDDIVYRFTFTTVNQDPTTFFRIRLGKENWKTSYTLERSMNGGMSFTTIVTAGTVPPPNIGPRSIENPVVGLGASSYDALMTSAITTATTGEKVFAGPIDDPFFVDLGGIFDVGNFRKEGMARDAVAKFNCHSLVLEVPVSTLQKDHKNETQAKNILDGDYVIGVWASASRREVTTLDQDGGPNISSGKWVQVSRLGMPLTNEVINPIGVKDNWNMSNPANDILFSGYLHNPELALYMDDSKFGPAVPGLADLRIQSKSLGSFDFRNGQPGLFPLRYSPAVAGTAFDEAIFGGILLPDNKSPRAVDLLPIFNFGVPNLRPYQLATGKPANNPLAAGKPFINNFLPTGGDMLRLNMAVPATKRNSPDFSSLGLVKAAVLGLTDSRFNANASLQNIPNMDGFPNGRRLEDDVTTIELQAVGGVVLAAIGLWYDDYTGGSPVTPQLIKTISFNAGVTHNDTTFKACYPFVQAPWRGFNGPSYVGPLSCDPPTFLNNQQIVLNASCGRNDGSISVIPTNGNAPFMYSMDGGKTYVSGASTGYTFNNLAPGTYQIRLKTGQGCESSMVEIKVGLASGLTFLNNSRIVLNATCGKNDGNISIIPSGGTAPYMYSINGGASYVSGPNGGYTFNNLAPGMYKLRLKDANGCETAVVEKMVSQPKDCPLMTTLQNGAGSTTIGDMPFQSTKEIVLTYPNPSRGQFKLQLQNFIAGQVEVSIIDGKGTLVEKRSINTRNGNLVNFNLAGHAKGTYYVKVVSSKGTSSSKILIQ